MWTPLHQRNTFFWPTSAIEMENMEKQGKLVPVFWKFKRNF